jgi:SAM-dependent methyltransferase
MEMGHVRSRRGARFAWWVKRGAGLVFDALHAVDTEVGHSAQPLGITSVNRDKAVPYDPAPWRVLTRSLRLASLQAPGFTFVDIGCGKGKVLLSAVALPFQQIVGVEFSALLCRIAEQNLTGARFIRRRCSAVQIVCSDAAKYPIPEEPTIFFFYNPFTYEVMEIVLGNILSAHRRAPYARYLIFYAASSSMPKIEQFLQSVSGGCPRFLVSSRLGRRSVNIFELSDCQGG